MSSHLAKRIETLERRKKVEVGENYTVVGFVCPKEGFTHSISNEGGEWHKTDEVPSVYFPAKFEKVVTSRKRFIVLIGGRGSAKSISVADLCLIEAKDRGSKTYFLREYQASITNSVHSLLKEEINRLEFDGFEVQQSAILHNKLDAFQFAGLSKSTDSIKSSHGFKRYSIEEAQFISQDSLNTLTPTARKKPKKGMPTQFEEVEDQGVFASDTDVSLIFVANPGSSEDPFSKRFINPFLPHIERDGYYEDDTHLIIKMNHYDNPWYDDSGLEEQRLFDKEHLPPALYDHIWEGDFNDSVENALIMREWFDACVDAHKRLNFEALGKTFAAHDPSDRGPDHKGYGERHGSVVTYLDEKHDGDVNEGGDWATNLANEHAVDSFTWDGDGIGAALNRQIGQAFHRKSLSVAMFKGSESPDFADQIYQPSTLTQIQNQKTWAEVCKNKRSQYYLMLRERIYKTYRFVIFGEHADVEDMISFDSNIDCLLKLRSELCRMPTKPNSNGQFELYRKDEMKLKFKMASPNLADTVMMLMRNVAPVNRPNVHIPAPLKPMGGRR